jgi:hypothetical protein
LNWYGPYGYAETGWPYGLGTAEYCCGIGCPGYGATEYGWAEYGWYAYCCGMVWLTLGGAAVA